MTRIHIQPLFVTFPFFRRSASLACISITCLFTPNILSSPLFAVEFLKLPLL
jgi:hypothetical protein